LPSSQCSLDQAYKSKLAEYVNVRNIFLFTFNHKKFPFLQILKSEMFLQKRKKNENEIKIKIKICINFFWSMNSPVSIKGTALPLRII
jgi:hypothetical protein